MYSRNFHIYGMRRMLYQTSRFVADVSNTCEKTLNENNRHSFDAFGLKSTSLEIHMHTHVPSDRSISLFGYPTASEFGPCPWEQLKWDHGDSLLGQGGGGAKVRTISWITNEGRNDIKLADFRTYNQRASYVRRCAQKGRSIAMLSRVKAPLVLSAFTTAVLSLNVYWNECAIILTLIQPYVLCSR